MRHLRLLSLAALLLVSEHGMFAGAGFPLLKGAISKNGEFVVSLAYEYEEVTPGMKRLKTVTYHVARRDAFINHPFNASNTYWSGSAWEVAIASSQRMYGLAIPLISDDGKTMALLTLEHAFSRDTEALAIYRQKDSGAEQVGKYHLGDIWNSAELEQQVLMGVATDHSPLWFEGSGFEFSADSKQLVVQNKTGRTVRIELKRGKVVADKP